MLKNFLMFCTYIFLLKRKFFFFGLFLTFLLCVFIPQSFANPSQKTEVKNQVFQDWEIVCEKIEAFEKNQCALIQNVTAEDRKNVGLSVFVLKTADQKMRILRVLAPLGVLLPSGLGLTIDAENMGRVGFVRCLLNGCIAEVVIDETLLRALENGKNATFAIFQVPEEGIGIPVSLSGFKAGFEALP